MLTFDHIDHYPSAEPADGSWVSDCISEPQCSSTDETHHIPERYACESHQQRHFQCQANSTTSLPMTPKDTSIAIQWRSHNPYQRASLDTAKDILGRVTIPASTHIQPAACGEINGYHCMPHFVADASIQQEDFFAPVANYHHDRDAPPQAGHINFTIPAVMCCYYKQRGTCKMGAGCWHGHFGLPSTPCHYGSRCKAGHAHLVNATHGQPTVSSTTVDPLAVCRLCSATSLFLQVIPVFSSDHMECATRAMCPTCKGTFLMCGP
jgi:hypothetical protein